MADTKKKKSGARPISDYSAVIGERRPFATAEAHKRLRTNVMFSFAEEAGCRVIGVTSAMAHEGKTTTSINLAYDLMRAKQKVLLIDADMRMSNIVRILDVNKSPGLSNLLIGGEESVNCIQSSSKLGGLHVISCGFIPPNPSELLSSQRMVAAIEKFKTMYDYIVIDLPPIAAVSDALIVSKLTDGIVVVVRQEFADKRLMDDAIRQLQFHEANIIGFVMNCTHVENKYYGKYGKYGKYKKYSKYSRYGYGYGYYNRRPEEPEVKPDEESGEKE